MDERITYTDDFYGWSQQQASVLRRMAGRRDLPNELDLQHVAEEIEDVGNAQRSSVQSFLRLIFVHLLKSASVTSPELRTKWQGEIAGFHNELLTRFSISMRPDIDVATLWRRAFKEASLDLRGHGQEIALPPSFGCPFEIDDFLNEEFDFDAALDRIDGSLDRSEGRR